MWALPLALRALTMVPDVAGILHADIAGNDLVLSEGHVLRVHLG